VDDRWKRRAASFGRANRDRSYCLRRASSEIRGIVAQVAWLQADYGSKGGDWKFGHVTDCREDFSGEGEGQKETHLEGEKEGCKR